MGNELELNRQQDVDTLVKLVMPKLLQATAKKAPAKFLTDAVKGLQVKVTLAETEALHKACQEMHKKRKKIEQEAEKKKREEEEAAKKEKEMPKNEVDDADYFKDFM